MVPGTTRVESPRGGEADAQLTGPRRAPRRLCRLIRKPRHLLHHVKEGLDRRHEFGPVRETGQEGRPDPALKVLDLLAERRPDPCLGTAPREVTFLRDRLEMLDMERV